MSQHLGFFSTYNDMCSYTPVTDTGSQDVNDDTMLTLTADSSHMKITSVR